MANAANARATYVTSRSFELPRRTDEMDGSMWFNLWQRELWPYREVELGDELYWYESPSKTIVWRTVITGLTAFPYDDLGPALARLDDEFGVHIDRTQPYLDGKPYEGVALAYVVEVVEPVDIPKPDWVPKFNQMGWERATNPRIARWLGQDA